MNETRNPAAHTSFNPYAITKPAPVLMFYYALVSLAAGPAFVIPLVALFCKYVTLRYRFDEKGISTSHGVLFKRETLLTYRRIQDIHLTHNIVQRWLGLATVSIQTASGSAGAEMAIEGILEAEELRDFLYQKMRGARGLDHEVAAATGTPLEATVVESGGRSAAEVAAADEATALLRDIRDSLRSLAPRQGTSS